MSIKFPGSPVILPLASAALGFLAFPGIGFSSLAWFSLVPLILCIHQCKNVRMAFGAGTFSGAVQVFALLIWIPRVLVSYGNISLWLAWLLYGLLAAFLGIYTGFVCATTHFCIRRLGNRGLFVFAFAWIAAELLRTWTPFGGFPWLLMGYSQTDNMRIIQVADITGVYGVSLLIAWINAATAWLLISRQPMNRRVWALIAGIVGLSACLLYGEVSLRRWSNIPAEFNVAILQGDISIDDPNELAAWKSREGYAALAASLGPQRYDLLLLPESPSPYYYQFDESYREAMKQLAGKCALGLVFDNISCLTNDRNSRYFNSAYFLDGQGRELGRYDKIHLVPFGEYLPWKRIFFFAETITKDVSGFSPGSVYLTVPYGRQRMNAIICFEAIFPDLTGEFIRGGSQLIINLTNDRWYGRSAAPYQHLAMARWRAVENRRFLLRAANSGISTIVRPTGQLDGATPILERATCTGRFAFISGETWYAGHGNVFAGLCAMIFVLFFVAAAWPGRKTASDTMRRTL